MFHPRLILLVLGIWVGAAAAQTPPPAKPIEERVMPMEVVVNGAKTGTWLLIERAGEMYAPRDAFEEWRVQLQPGTQGFSFRGVEYLPLSAVAGYSAKTDFANQSVDLSFSPEVFAATRLSGPTAKRLTVSPVLPSLFLNYDLNYTGAEIEDGPSSGDAGLVGELGFSTGVGVLTSTFFGRKFTSTVESEDTETWLRLETTFTRDMLEQGRTLRIGDASTRMGMWGRSVYFGGIQFGTNFALTPGFISRPLPVLSGVSTAPSTVELYVNDVLNRVSNVPPGPFVIDNAPILTGSGEARIVVRDLLGRETSVVLPFFTTSELLAAGLHDWSVEAGSLRNNLGIESNDYGPNFASGTWRHGFTNALTVEGRVEATPQMTTLGVSAVAALPGQFLGKAAAVTSRTDNEVLVEAGTASDPEGQGGGNFRLLGLEYYGLQSGVSLEVQEASINFRQLGQDLLFSPIKRQVAGNFYYSTRRQDTFGLGYARIEQHDDTEFSTLSVNYTARLGQRSSLSFTASRALDGEKDTTAAVIFMMPLDGSRYVTAVANTRDGADDYYVTASQNIGRDNNLGWRVMGGRLQDEEHAEGSLYYLGRYGRSYGEISSTPSQKTARVGANGGMVLADGHLFASRRVDSSFAIAEVAGYSDIGIGLGSNMLTKTDSDGVAMIPQLVPYQSNSVRLDPRELPINAEIDSIEQLAVPAWRSGVKVTFPVRSGRGALLKIVLDDGDVVPAGATVQIEGDTQEFYVARRGEAFVTGLAPVNYLRLKWKDQQCRIEVNLPPETPDEFPRVGPLPCPGVAR
jgi:outer membrane usher protein